MTLNDYRVPPANGGDAGRAVIFLHGLGDRGDGGLLSIGQMWQRALPDCAFICPDAPFAFDMAPPDFGGRQWFSLRELAPAYMLAGVKQAAPFLDAYIDHVLASLKLTPDRLALVGFSQGTMMALYVALRRAAPVACVVGYSGMLVGGEALPAEKKSAPPVLLVHGTADDVVPFAAMAEGEYYLKAAAVPVQTLACPMTGHTIDEAGVMAGMQFIRKAWALRD
jgi:phospholipase/carboxylesterase